MKAATYSLVFSVYLVTASSHHVEKKLVSRLFQREGTCVFPSEEGMVAVQQSGANAGWAMHWDQPCSFGTWCPYACKPGKLMGQWNPAITSYTYPGSQWGGLYCDENGQLQKMIADNPFCYDGKGTVSLLNNAGSDIALCQTVLPGNEEMLIPTVIGTGNNTVLAVPGTDYWAGTASHFYINPPGVSVSDGCKWGSVDKPWGNWSPYVAGANMDDHQNTYVKIGWNPVYLETATPFRNDKPNFGVRIICDNESDCLGLPCSIDPTQGVNFINSPQAASGAGGGDFCVVTARNGAKAKIEVFEVGSAKAKRAGHHVHQSHAA